MLCFARSIAARGANVSEMQLTAAVQPACPKCTASRGASAPKDTPCAKSKFNCGQVQSHGTCNCSKVPLVASQNEDQLVPVVSAPARIATTYTPAAYFTANSPSFRGGFSVTSRLGEDLGRRSPVFGESESSVDAIVQRFLFSAFMPAYESKLQSITQANHDHQDIRTESSSAFVIRVHLGCNK